VSDRHSAEWINIVSDAADGAGGATVVVLGEPRVPGRGAAYWAGGRFAPADGLFEAVLRLLLSAHYDRILAFTGHGASHLPQWSLGSGLTLGDEAAVWLVKGEAHSASARPERPSQPAGSFEVKVNVPTAPQIKRLIWRSLNRGYWDRLDKLVEERRREVDDRRRDHLRTALIVDERFLRPTPHETKTWTETIGLDEVLSRKLEREFRLGDLGSTDFFLVAEEEAARELTVEEGHYLRATLPSVMGNLWNRLEDGIAPLLPRLWLGGAKIATARRSRHPFRSGYLSAAGDVQSRGVYEYLQQATMGRDRVPVEPPADSTLVALEMWARLDLKPLEQALRQNVIGQQEVVDGVLTRLRAYCRACDEVLALNPAAIRTNKDSRFLPPVFVFLGAAGMGKTTILKLIGEHLFGSDDYTLHIDLSSRRLGPYTIGANAPYVGYDQETPLIRFARENHGLGVIGFDEFTRVERDQGQDVNEALNPLLDIVPSRAFSPTNPRFGRRLFLTNSILIFAANISKPGQAPPPGFVSMDSLGPPLRRRLWPDEPPFFFESLQPKDYQTALRSAVIASARKYASDYSPEHVRLVDHPAVDDELVSELRERFEEVLAASNAEPSMAAVAQTTQRLAYKNVFQDAIARSADAVVLDRRLLG
jgi:hypothetical protein